MRSLSEPGESSIYDSLSPAVVSFTPVSSSLFTYLSPTSFLLYPFLYDALSSCTVSDPISLNLQQAAAAVAAAAPPVQLRVKAPNSESERAKNMEARNSVSYDLWSSRLTTVLVRYCCHSVISSHLFGVSFISILLLFPLLFFQKKHGYLQKKRIHDPSGKK